MTKTTKATGQLKAPSTIHPLSHVANELSAEEKQWITVTHKKKKSQTSKLTSNQLSSKKYTTNDSKEKPQKRKTQGKKDKGLTKSTKPLISFLSIMGYKADANGDDAAESEGTKKGKKKNKKKKPTQQSNVESGSNSITTVTNTVTPTLKNEDESNSPIQESEQFFDGSLIEKGMIDGSLIEEETHSRNSVVKLKELSNASKNESMLLSLPYDTLTGCIMSFLEPNDLLAMGSTNKMAQQLTQDGFLWQSIFRERFPDSQLNPKAMKEWKLAYQLSLSRVVNRLRCFATKQTFFEDVIGVGVDFTINPKTKCIDYISVSQDLISQTAFAKNKVRSDVFGNKFQLFLPLYFSEEHFQRALPMIRKTVARLCPEKKCGFQPSMVLDVFPKIITTFVVLLSDEGVSASRKSFSGLIRMHRLFLAMANQYPSIKQHALKNLSHFMAKEENRCKSSCPSLGAILPLLMIVDEDKMDWRKIRPTYLGEMFDRAVLWVCKDHPHLELTRQPDGKPESMEQAEERLRLTRGSMTVVLRLTMFHVFFLKSCCQGSAQSRASKYDIYFGQPEPEDMKTPSAQEGEDDSNLLAADGSNQASKVATGRTKSPLLSYEAFRSQVNEIHTSTGWQSFFHFVGLKGAQSKEKMAQLLRMHIQNSQRKRYHTAGMDFSQVQAGGTSKILSKGQKYSASSSLKNLVFHDSWQFNGETQFLDATCIMFDKHKNRVCVVDYLRKEGLEGSVVHSGDVMHQGGGTHTIHIDLSLMPVKVAMCVFVISAWNGAKLSDIVSPLVSFSDADAEDSASPLCVYELDKQDKIDHLTSVIMCKLYRTQDGRWHVQAVGDAHRGDASNYGPILQAVEATL
mmetsp:Transcript_6714/g.17280  ORF Transcript_6714/g.17280 Transcript_6714/m.17280 type:complete len:853 (-) Transcript_6714:134-2692(-)